MTDATVRTVNVVHTMRDGYFHRTAIDKRPVDDAVRVGRLVVPGGGPPVPALVPLLDAAHVAVTGDRPGEAISALLLRALGTTAPGTVRLTGYDPEHLGGALAGFAPLSGAGLLTFVGPGGLGDLLDDLVDQVRRINETVLAGAYPPGDVVEQHGLLGRPDADAGDGEEVRRVEGARKRVRSRGHALSMPRGRLKAPDRPELRPTPGG